MIGADRLHPDGWELEMNHDKLYLSNPTKEIEQFAISHGFNRMGSVSWVRVPVADGEADLAVGGLHGLLGVGYGW